MKIGSLYLVPCFLGNPDTNLIAPANRTVIHALKHFVVENSKSARLFLKQMEIPTPQSELDVFEMEKHHPKEGLSDFLQVLKQGHDVGVITEAGMPCVADPGHLAVQIAHKLGAQVKPLQGLNSMMMALMASGFGGNQFTFNGYLPCDNNTRFRKIKEMEALAFKGVTQLFMETPYRNEKMINELLFNLHPNTLLTVAINISHPDEKIATHTIGQWKDKIPNMHKLPAVFIIGKY